MMLGSSSLVVMCFQNILQLIEYQSKDGVIYDSIAVRLVDSVYGIQRFFITYKMNWRIP